MIFIADIIVAQHVSGTIMPIIRSSRVIYRWLLPVVFGALVFKLSVCCGAEGYVSGLRTDYAHHQELIWLLPVVFGVLVFKLSVWCGAEGYVSGLQAAY